MSEVRHRIAIYDMDKTVTRRATYNGFLIHMAMERSPWRLFLLPALPVGLLLYALRIWDRGRLKTFAQQLLIGRRVSRAELAAHLETHADLVLGRNVYPQARERIAQEKAAGYIHVLATASYRLYVEAIGQRLGFDHVLATDLATSDTGHVLARIDGPNTYDAAKLEKVKAWLAAQGWDRADCFVRAYSDHVSDAPLLGWADEAYAVNPHGHLRRLAARRGWQVIDWR